MSLEERGLLVAAPDDMLCGTEERLLWPGFWRHYWGAPGGGLRRVLETLLDDVGVEPTFGVRIDSIEATDTRLRVQGVHRLPALEDLPHPGLSRRREEAWAGEYDCIIACVPAPNALEIDGLAALLPPPSAHVLRSVRYDARTTRAVWFRGAEFCARLRRLFSGLAELDELDLAVGGHGSHPMHLMALQVSE